MKLSQVRRCLTIVVCWLSLLPAAHADNPIPPKSLAEASVRAFGAICDGSNDDTSSFNIAIAATRRLYIPSGICVVNNVQLLSNTELIGEGDGSVLRASADAHYALSANADIGGSTQQIDNVQHVRLSHLQLQGGVASNGFDEHRYLLNLNAVNDVIIDSVSFIGFRGDGIYLGSSNMAGQERHNADVTIRNCRFDGVNGQNRNAISVIDIDNLLIENSTFQNTTRADMPGAIDLEPNDFSFQRMRKIRIRNNRFTNIGGNSGAISIYIPPQVATEPAQLLISGNQFAHIRSNAIMMFRDKAVADNTSAHRLLIQDNQVDDCSRPFSLFGVRGATISHNHFSHCANAALLGFIKPQHLVRDISVDGNVFDNDGSQDKFCLEVFYVDTLAVRNNQFVDCGDGSESSAAINLGQGHSSNLQLFANHFLAPAHRTHYAVRLETGHSADASSNQFGGNEVDPGLTVNLPLPPPPVASDKNISTH